MNKEKLSIKQKLELEEFLSTDTYLKNKDLSLDNFEQYIRSLNIFNNLEITYLIYAYLMPLDEVESDINYYDNKKPNIDGLLFIKDFVYVYLNKDNKELTRKEYKFLTKIAINRIREVRKLTNYKESKTRKRFKL